MQAKLGIDIGGANLLAAALGQGILMREPSAIAQDRETGRVLAVGLAAEQRLGQGGQSVALSRPFTNGLTAVPHVTQAVLASCILTAGGYPDKTDVLLSVPCDLTDDQEEQLVGLACRAGARTCRLVYAPLAAVAGSFMNLPQGCLAVDIGATATHVMLLCRGRIYYMKSVPTGGQALDQAIADYMLRRRKVKINLRTAEQVKIQIGTVWGPGAPPKEMNVSGKDTNGNPVTVKVSSTELYGPLETPISKIIEAVWLAVAKIPSEYVKSVFSVGIQLCGGGALLDGLDKIISGVTGVATHRVDEPLSCTALGLAEIMAALPEDIPPAYRNVSEIYIKQVYLSGRGEQNE